MIQKIKLGEILFKVDDMMPLLRYVEGTNWYYNHAPKLNVMI